MAFERTSATAACRRLSEDRLAMASVRGGVAIVLADGAGGMTGGAAAAEMAVGMALRGMEEAFGDPFSLVALLSRIDREVHDDPRSGETTIVIVTVDETRLAGASAGDSEAWLIGRSEIDDLTGDQHRKRRMGSGRAEPVSFVRPSIGRNTLLVASDGLIAFASRDAIVRAICDVPVVDEAARALVELVRPPSGRFSDDVSVILARDLA